MKTYTAIAAAILAIFVLDPSPGAAAEVTYHAPKTAAALRATDLLKRGARAVSAYLAATDKDARVTDLWLFPTNDANSLFVEYRLTSDKPLPNTNAGEHLAVITMRGDSIAQLRDLSQTATMRSAAASDRSKPRKAATQGIRRSR